ncbi:MAG TPA: CoA pyrophosphatase [Bryobacteraceae bacterium]|nr:CoA pyrophosphatase [Bryobacteraceae bacterium]
MIEDPPSEAEAAVAILHAREPEEAILLIRRATNPQDPWSGHWAFPGGRRDAADHDLLDTALRELREECSIELSRDHLTQSLPWVWAGRRLGSRLCVAPFGFVLPHAIPAFVDPEEAVQALWAPVSMLADKRLHARMPVPGFPNGTHWPAIEINSVPMWGFTYRLVCQWIGIETLPEA